MTPLLLFILASGLSFLLLMGSLFLLRAHERLDDKTFEQLFALTLLTFAAVAIVYRVF